MRGVYDELMPQSLPDGLLALLDRPSLCFIATLMPDGSPQLTETWVTTDGRTSCSTSSTACRRQETSPAIPA